MHSTYDRSPKAWAPKKNFTLHLNAWFIPWGFSYSPRSRLAPGSRLLGRLLYNRQKTWWPWEAGSEKDESHGNDPKMICRDGTFSMEKILKTGLDLPAPMFPWDTHRKAVLGAQ